MKTIHIRISLKVSEENDSAYTQHQGQLKWQSLGM